MRFLKIRLAVPIKNFIILFDQVILLPGIFFFLKLLEVQTKMQVERYLLQYYF